MKKLIPLLALLLLLALPTCAQELEIGALSPVGMDAAYGETTLIDLYCGPTMGFYRDGEAVIDLGQPFVFFGQYDCWAMAAQGTADSFGPVGWVEAGSIPDIPYEPQLGFEDGFAAMVEETAPMTDNPLAEDPFDGWTAALEPGTPIIVLAQYGDWLYVQSELEDMPVRAFIMADTVF